MTTDDAITLEELAGARVGVVGAGRTGLAVIEALADLLASVQPELRIVWVLREVDDMSYEEIAQALNLTESTVRGRLARARSLVMRQMKEWA